ncbi:MAG: 23S rRNA (adenine(2503)-C(2))-methyltransferase RlmN [Lachnospiraceae bacterium]|nr:23S rRNA (adenine(2503)-C(2))-methyltransferase RlmN [Lachnospiraceae bacterium]MBO7363639.1 23S rRNA (adenine(2503)-C(2))-methyltransferase RlmN [Lachnospiraceae bacterium]MBP5471388.1 23S rRNA (adenine(2503)-C(2))-methyltransferase RlmN [Lachnospiraceae bacterium]
MKDIKSLTLSQLKEEMATIGEKPFRAGQIYKWLHVKLVSSFEEMTDLSAALREKLSSEYEITDLKKLEVQVSKDDGTRKYLFELGDGNTVESVLMRYHHGNSVCISSQVGCRMGCKFCASTIGGCIRSLEPSEMLDQIYKITNDINERVSNVVVMGMGEPLENFDNLIRFITLVTDENGLNISQRNITVSTCGLVPEIRKLADLHLSITLAISLHAGTDEKRKALMPIANKYSLDELLGACSYYFMETGRRLTFEYALIAGVNDTPLDADEIAGLARKVSAHVNLIPVNPVTETGFRPTSGKDTNAFKQALEKRGVNSTVRREMGRDIDGACGQLRKRMSEK